MDCESELLGNTLVIQCSDVFERRAVVQYLCDFYCLENKAGNSHCCETAYQFIGVQAHGSTTPKPICNGYKQPIRQSVMPANDFLMMVSENETGISCAGLEELL